MPRLAHGRELLHGHRCEARLAERGDESLVGHGRDELFRHPLEPFERLVRPACEGEGVDHHRVGVAVGFRAELRHLLEDFSRSLQAVLHPVLSRVDCPAQQHVVRDGRGLGPVGAHSVDEVECGIERATSRAHLYGCGVAVDVGWHPVRFHFVDQLEDYLERTRVLAGKNSLMVAVRVGHQSVGLDAVEEIEHLAVFARFGACAQSPSVRVQRRGDRANCVGQHCSRSRLAHELGRVAPGELRIELTCQLRVCLAVVGRFRLAQIEELQRTPPVTCLGARVH
mmetsp:Transcript_36870/g.91802  ORF Transcript_36870/g.91802 Transcript_36870/m.91802 type:complete len:282 (+) Transcript_36870:225-1070(+)